MNENQGILKSFLKYNIAAISATVVDFFTFIMLKDIFHLWYIFSTLISALLGGITAFTLNRNWVFHGKNGKLSSQIVKYLTVWGGSIFLNTYGLYLFVEYIEPDETISKIIVAAFIGFTYNFLLSKFLIFK